MKLIISSIFLLTTLISHHLATQYYTGQKVFSSKFPSELKEDSSMIFKVDEYIITLTEVEYENLSQSGISEDEFFN
jgi:hypothetical protein